MAFDARSVDLLELSRRLAGSLGSDVLPTDLLNGKTWLRDRVVEMLGCSELEAENLVDTLVARGFVRFFESAEEPEGGVWRLQTRLP